MDRKVILDVGRNLMKQSRAEDVRKMQAQITALKAGLREAVEVVRFVSKGMAGSWENDMIMIGTAANLLPNLEDLVGKGGSDG